MAEQPAALQLRLLQTVVEVAAEKNSTLVLPFPVELLRFLERSTPQVPAEDDASRSNAAQAADGIGLVRLDESATPAGLTTSTDRPGLSA
jgi:hypothetical protein